jgi:hypothetical protein
MTRNTPGFVPKTITLVTLRAESPNLLAEYRRVVNRRLPDKRPIDADVLVNENVPQPHNIGPRHRVVPLPDFLAQPRDNFADNRQCLGDHCGSRRINQFGLSQHSGPDEWLQRGLDGQIDAAAQQCRELTHHCRNTQKPRPCAWQEIDEKVDVAVRPHLTPRSRTEEG